MKYTITFFSVIACALGAVIPDEELVPTQNGLAEALAEHGGLVPLLESQNLIIGGSRTSIERFPWTVTLQRFGGHRCGGCIIRENRILTAAHCVAAVSTSGLAIRAGSSYRQFGGQTRSVSQIRIHPQYNHRTLNNDIAVLRIASSLTMNPAGVSTIRIPNQSERVSIGAMAQVTGWGSTCEGCIGSSHLRYVTVPIISNADCNRMYNGGITDSMLCAGFPQGGRDACQGDSGGPLVVGGTLVGVVSWGHGCARPNRPGVYARTASFGNWINSQL